MEFDSVWTKLQSILQPHTVIPNWTADHGYFHGSMIIIDVDDDFIKVKSPNAQELQHVRKQDFEAIWKIWAEYKNGKYRRGNMTELTRYSKYVISIFHWLEMNE